MVCWLGSFHPWQQHNPAAVDEGYLQQHAAGASAAACAGPDRSIIKQSYDARERLQDPSLPNHLGFGNLNGDGFGIGWYAPDDLREGDPTPCMYKSITPAW